jgi:hypothetical protein
MFLYRKCLINTLNSYFSSVCRGPHFELMATARLSLDDVHDSIHTHDMQVENLGESSQGRIT